MSGGESSQLPTVMMHLYYVSKEDVYQGTLGSDLECSVNLD